MKINIIVNLIINFVQVTELYHLFIDILTQYKKRYLDCALLFLFVWSFKFILQQLQYTSLQYNKIWNYVMLFFFQIEYRCSYLSLTLFFSYLLEL